LPMYGARNVDVERGLLNSNSRNQKVGNNTPLLLPFECDQQETGSPVRRKPANTNKRESEMRLLTQEEMARMTQEQKMSYIIEACSNGQKVIEELYAENVALKEENERLKVELNGYKETRLKLLEVERDYFLLTDQLASANRVVGAARKLKWAKSMNEYLDGVAYALEQHDKEIQK